jgi:beta-glucanase (GH16 family)
MTVLMDEDFTATDWSKWCTTGYDWAPGQPNSGNASESQSYQPSAVTAANGKLVLTATKKSQTVNGKTYPYTSGMVTTSKRLTFCPNATQAVYISVYAALPMTPGMWSAIWLLPQDYSWPPEIDLMEAWGNQSGRVTHNDHWASNGQAVQISGWPTSAMSQLDPTVVHDYGLVWATDYLSFHVDGVEVQRITDPAAIPTKPMYLLINLAVEGSKVNSSTVLPAKMLIDRVRIAYQ